MLVTKQNFQEVMQTITAWPEMSLDTETTGLRPYLGHHPFSIVVSNGEQSFYFPIMKASGLTEWLGEHETSQMVEFFANNPINYYLQNAKFDLHHLHCSGFDFSSDATFTDTAVLARLHHSDLSSYSLDFLAQHYLGAPKGKGPMDYVKEQIKNQRPN